MYRAVLIVSLPLFLSLAGCPPQEEPVKVGTEELKQEPTRAQPAPSPAAAEPVEPEPTPPAGTTDARAPDPEPMAKTTINPDLEPPSEAEQNQVPTPNRRPARAATAEPDPPAVKVDARDVYSKKCKTCHGTDGKAETKMGEKHDIPDMTAPGWKQKWPRAKVQQVVQDGKAGTKMKPFKDKLTPEEINAVTDFVRSL